MSKIYVYNLKCIHRPTVESLQSEMVNGAIFAKSFPKLTFWDLVILSKHIALIISLCLFSARHKSYF